MQKSPIVIPAIKGNFSPCSSSFNPHIEYSGSASQTRYITAVLAEKASVTRAQTIRSTTQPRYLVLLRTSLVLNQLMNLQSPCPDRGWGFQPVRVCKSCYAQGEGGREGRGEAQEVQVRDFDSTSFLFVSNIF